MDDGSLVFILGSERYRFARGTTPLPQGANGWPETPIPDDA